MAKRAYFPLTLLAISMPLAGIGWTHESGHVHRFSVTSEKFEEGRLRYSLSAIAVVTGPLPGTIIRIEPASNSSPVEFRITIAKNGQRGLQWRSAMGDKTQLSLALDVYTTLLVASQPQIPQLGFIGDAFEGSDYQQFTWGIDDPEVIVGGCCHDLRVKLKKITGHQASIVGVLTAPAAPCMVLNGNWLSDKTGDKPANFQQLKGLDKDFTAMRGREEMTVTANIDRRDGSILHAVMITQLDATAGRKCDEEFARCKKVAAISRRATLTLKPLP